MLTSRNICIAFGSVFVLVGFTMIGPEAGAVVAVVQTAMLASLSYTKLRDAILAHPTMAEGLGSLFSNVPSRSVQEVAPKSALVSHDARLSTVAGL